MLHFVLLVSTRVRRCYQGSSSSSRNHSSCVLHILTATACLPACICVMNMHMSECGACMHQCRAWCLRELFVLAESILNGGPRP